MEQEREGAHRMLILMCPLDLSEDTFILFHSYIFLHSKIVVRKLACCWFKNKLILQYSKQNRVKHTTTQAQGDLFIYLFFIFLFIYCHDYILLSSHRF